MKLSQKKTCRDCKAYSYTHKSECDFGIEIEDNNYLMGVAISNIPKAPCYKPKTNRELILVRQLFD